MSPSAPDSAHESSDLQVSADGVSSGEWSHRLRVGGLCVVSGLAIALSIPPFGWWPLAFVGIFGWDRLIAHQPAPVRFRRSWLVAIAWLAPTMLWMFDLTPPGYVFAAAVFASYFGFTVAAIPSDHRRWIGLPAAIVLAEQARWTFPFGGVPLANLALGQADAPLRFVVRIAGPLLLVAVVVLGGLALSAAYERRFVVAGALLTLVVMLGIGGWLAPSGTTFDTLDIAIVQGGGPQRTRAADTDEEVVFERHLDASDAIEGPVDLVLWPENVVNVEGALVDHEFWPQLTDLAKELNATLSVGVVEGGPIEDPPPESIALDEDHFANSQIIINPDGSYGGRFDKVRIVPFGEFVPFRSLVDGVAGDQGLPERDALAGSGPGQLSSEVAELGVLISWEVFFANRAVVSVDDDTSLVINPTNGASYWLTQVQSQQTASSRLRALETGRWMLQAAPTGFSAVVTPDGEVVERTAISEEAVMQHTVELRSGSTWANAVGHWPLFVLSVLTIPLLWFKPR